MRYIKFLSFVAIVVLLSSCIPPRDHMGRSGRKSSKKSRKEQRDVRSYNDRDFDSNGMW